MAEEQVTTAAASAPTAVSSPLSSPSPSPSAPVPSATKAADVSTKAPASPDTTATTRPEGIPDSYWDTEKNSLKVDAAALAKDLKERDELRTWKAADDVKAASRYQKADDVKLELPADFKSPPGVDFKLDAANPALGQLKEFAVKHGMTPTAVSELLGIYAGNEVGTEAGINAAAAAQVAKLGATGPALVDASTRWLDSVGLPSWKPMMVTAQQVTELQGYINKVTSQGAAAFSQQHRAGPDDGKIAGYDKMTFEQKRLAQDQSRARRTA